jgi:hypothetical protein
MTVTEQLQFSVLTAPVAGVDRRGLSEAWYSALYGTANTAHPDAPAAREAGGFSTRIKQAERGDAHAAPEPSQRAGAAVLHDEHIAREAGADLDRRSPRSALARKIERAFLRPHKHARKASFTIDDEHGRVHVVLQSNGTQLKLIAICPPKACARVASALAQARYALAMRGIDLDAGIREQAAC